jgi:DNA-binding transcriptional LysR family regulator
MEIEPNDLLLFARIVEAGSFSMAAERLELPKSTVSRRIALLEASLGERLLQRTTRKLVLTEFGASLLEHARKVVEEVEAAGALAQHRQAAPSGRCGSRCRPTSPTWHERMIAQFMNAIRRCRWNWTCRRAGSTWWPRASTSRSAWATCRTTRRSTRAASPSGALRPVRGAVVHRAARPARASGRPAQARPAVPASAPQRPAAALDFITRQNRWERELPARLTANSPELLARIACTGAGIAASSEAVRPAVCANRGIGAGAAGMGRAAGDRLGGLPGPAADAGQDPGVYRHAGISV